jgi:hypothetical protein
MKRISFFKYAMLFVAAITLLGFNSCKDDDDPDPDPVFVEDGFYLSGAATGQEDLQLNAMMEDGRVEGEGFASLPRENMYEKFFYLTAGTFNIVEVAGTTQTTWGWDGAGQQQLVLDGTDDQIVGTVFHGTVTGDGTAFTVTTPGFYHIVVDKTTATAFFTHITHFAAIGDATDLGWSGEYKMEEVSAGRDSASWKGENIVIRERGGIKFRYNSGWKISYPNITDTEYIAFANIGNDNGEWVMGAGTFAHPTPEGVYEVTLNWSLTNGWSFKYNKTGDVEPLPEYPETLYMIGSALNMADSDQNDNPDGWQWELTDAPMIPVAGNKAHLFWKIVWLNAGGEFKFAPQKAWAGDFGKSGEAVDGIFAKGSENIAAPATSGYYMVVVNLEEEKIAVVDPKVYLIGDAIASWDSANPAGLFTVDNANEVITITKDLSATPELRMYAWFDAAEGWFTDWWQSEFMILDGKIEYRGAGGDQARVAVDAANYTINLKFKDNTGSITKN